MLVLYACAMQVHKYPDATVVRLPAKSRPILVKKIVSQLSRGQEIGTIHIGGLCLRNGTLRWNTGGHVPMLNEELANHLNTDLTRQGMTWSDQLNPCLKLPTRGMRSSCWEES
jgi:hypothetical protein